MTIAILGFLGSFVLILLRVPIAIALSAAGFVGFGYLLGWNKAVVLVGLTAREATMNYTLAIIPLFILMGNLIAGTGVSKELFRAAQTMLGGRRGGLANATIVACAGFGMVCGSSVATVATMGTVAVPSMREHGYRDMLIAGTVAAGGTLGIIIPPSVILVIYGIITETHIGKLYAAALIPGLLGVVGYVLAVQWSIWRNPDLAPPTERAAMRDKLSSLTGVWPVVVLFGMVLGGIYAGLFTPTEAAGIGAFGAFCIALLRGRLNRRILLAILADSAEATAIIFGLLMGALIFTEFLNYSGAHSTLLAVVQGSDLSPYAVVLIICAIYLVLGALMEELSMLLLTVPLFFPVVVGLGYDGVWFGVLIAVLCQIGLIAPPVGMNLFVMRSFAPDIPVERIIRGVVPFIAADIVRVLLVATFPVVAMYLPTILFR